MSRKTRKASPRNAALIRKGPAASRSGRTSLAGDGWTVRTADRGLAAHYEHTLMITKDEPVLLTAA